MSEKKLERISESSIARIAGNLLSGYSGFYVIGKETPERLVVVRSAVAMAREIAAEVERTRPAAQTEDGK